ncbi:MAG: tyrosine-type recombinase/integrase [Acidovorax sp.]
MSSISIRASISSDIKRQTDASRSEALIEFSASMIQAMGPEELTIVQSKLGFGNVYGVWETPQKWMPPGSAREPALSKIDFKVRLTSAGAPESRLDNAILCLSRYAILLALIPSAKGRHAGGYLKPSTIADMLYKYCIKIFAISAKKSFKEQEGEIFFGNFTHEDWKALPSRTAKRGVENELDRALIFHHKGFWPDIPTHFVEHRSTPASNMGPDERPTKEEKSKKLQPLPDQYVAEVGWRALWIVKELGPALIEVAHLVADKLSHMQGSNRNLRSEDISSVLNSYSWCDSGGNVINRIPFDLHIRGVGMREDMIWPPRTGSQLLQLVKRLQMAHLWITLLSVGSRIGELLSMQPGVVVHSHDGMPFANGLTFKIVSKVGGETRDWPLPDVAVEALVQQEKLAHAISRLQYLTFNIEDRSGKSEALWLRLGSASEFRSTINNQLRDVVRSLGLTTEPDGENLSTHRLRKTVARLVAMAIAGAPKVLMDLFGHKTIEMTLNYILSDPEVQAEIKATVEAQTIMLAENAIENSSSNGGPASKTIAKIVSAAKTRLGSEYGAQNIRELADVLTMNGRHWALVRPGVICTKLPGSSGPCTAKVGRPEPSRCSWSCNHRLEDALLRDDVDRSIDQAIRMYEVEISSDNEIQAEFWAGQVLAHVRRFDDLFTKWSLHSTVARLLRSQDGGFA